MANINDSAYPTSYPPPQVANPLHQYDQDNKSGDGDLYHACNRPGVARRSDSAHGRNKRAIITHIGLLALVAAVVFLASRRTSLLSPTSSLHQSDPAAISTTTSDSDSEIGVLYEWAFRGYENYNPTKHECKGPS